MIRQADRVAKRVDLPFAFVEFRLHVGAVAFPFAACRAFVEAVGIWVDVDTPGLTVDNTCQHGFYRRIFVGEFNMGENLCRRVAQPHGVDVACQDESIGFAVQHLMFAGGIQRIRETVFEHPGQFRVFQFRFSSLDRLFYGCRSELPFFRSRAKACVL